MMTPEQRQQWLSERRTGIGASDAAAACGLSKWKTPLQLFLEKRGELETVENQAMYWGTALEPIVRQHFADITGRTVVVPGRIFRHSTLQWAIVTPDGISDGERLYEGKTARTADGWGEPGSAEIPLEYLMQVNHAMFVLDLPVADVAVLIGGQDFRIYEVPADAELQAMLIDRERDFWERVLRNEPPEPVSREDVKLRWPVATQRQITAADDIASACQVVAYLKQHIRETERRVDDLTAEIQAVMGDAEALLSASGDLLVTWKNIAAAPRFDSERFKAEHPDLWKQYLRQTTPQRRFLLKAKGEMTCPPKPLSAPPMAAQTVAAPPL